MPTNQEVAALEEYLKRKGVQTTLNQMVNELLKEKPADPFPFMVRSPSKIRPGRRPRLMPALSPRRRRSLAKVSHSVRPRCPDPLHAIRLLAAPHLPQSNYLDAQVNKPQVVSKLQGREVLDSRGMPTVEVDVFCQVKSGAVKVSSRTVVDM